jgi:hypothetical protein
VLKTKPGLAPLSFEASAVRRYLNETPSLFSDFHISRHLRNDLAESKVSSRLSATLQEPATSTQAPTFVKLITVHSTRAGTSKKRTILALFKVEVRSTCRRSSMRTSELDIEVAPLL